MTIESELDGPFAAFAKSGDLVTLSFTSNEDLDTRQLSVTPAALTVSIAGALPSGGSGNPASVSRISTNNVDSWVYSAGYSPDGKRIATAGRDGIVQIYTTDMDELLQIAESRVTRQLTAEEREKYGVLDLN